VSELELKQHHPIHRFAGWAGLALLCVLAAVSFTYFAYTYRFIIGLLAVGVLIAPAALFLVLSTRR